jgi:hypothetical protein
MIKLEQLTPADYERLKPFFVDQPYELCEYCLENILAWSTEEYQPHGAIHDDTLILAGEYENFPDERHLIMPIARDRSFSPEYLRNLALETGHSKYWFVPECYISNTGRDEVEKFFTVQKQQGSSDYIYFVEDLALLAGNKYSKKRNLINQFVKEFVSQNRVTVEKVTSENLEQCVEFIEEWCVLRNCENRSDVWMACEKEAAINAIRNISTFDSNALMLKIDGKVSAFSFISRLTSDMAVLQFEKAFDNIKGLYQYFDAQCCKTLLNKYTFVNKENDMDIPGLIKSKKSYYPVRYVHSYELGVRV